MQVVVLANALQKAEFANSLIGDAVWVETVSEFLHHPSADAYLDLNYSNSPERNELLKQLLPKVVIINSVSDILPETNTNFIRINGWNAFLSSPLLEASCLREEGKAKAAEAFSLFAKEPVWLPDEPGFITARVVSMIINEAYISLAEGVSTKEEINTAMKLGTAYPYGPFEWAEKIGLQKVVTLLQKLSKTQVRYKPAGLLVQEAKQAT